MIFDKKLLGIADEAEEALSGIFREIDGISFENTLRVLDAFAKEKVDDAMFAPSSGYGYDDRGREAIEKIYASLFGCESALVRHSIANGTSALTIALFGLLRPGDTLLSVTGKPYDTLDEVIGLSGKDGDGSLRDFGISYRECALGEDFLPLLDKSVKVVFIQRSKGYMSRPTLSPDDIDAIYEKVKKNSDAYVVVDNCYGEFTCPREPKADLLVGSLIKNPGGGMAESGGYLAGTARAVELCSYRLTSPGTGGEVGATLGQNKPILKGLFYAPHSVAAALKTAHFAAYVFEKLGYGVSPRWDERRGDIIQTVACNSADALCALCRGIQKGSPVDSYVTPEPWEMPGYSDKVIMAAGTFTQGSSVELSADGPLRPPYTAFLQGGLTYESGKAGILSAASEIIASRF